MGDPASHGGADSALFFRLLGALRETAPEVTLGPLALVPDGDVQRTSAGIQLLHLSQEYRGIPIQGGTLIARFSPDGEFLGMRGKLCELPATVVATPRCSDVDAVLEAGLRVAAIVEEEGALPPLRVSRHRPRRLGRFAGASRASMLHKPPFADPVLARLCYHLASATARLAWEVHLVAPDGYGEFDLLIAADGEPRPEVLSARKTVAHAVTGRVFGFDPEESDRVTVPFPLPRTDFPTHGGRAFTSEAGAWVSADATRGNNVASYRGNSRKTLKGVMNGADLLFAPSDASGTEQRILNAFYVCNFMHDFFLLLGFDEAAGNFQDRNVSGSGDDGDSLIVRVYDSGFQGIASMRSRRDGKHPELKLGSKDGRHSALDVGVVIHEFVHGVTNRVIGGRHTHDPLRGNPQSEAMGEGYSDYFALSILNYYRRREGRPQSGVYGAWLSQDPVSGLRRQPYDGSFSGGYGDLGSPAFTDAHDAGQLWCKALLDVTAALPAPDADGRSEVGWQLVMDSLKLLPADTSSPTLLDGRDAILQAFDDLVAAGSLVDPDGAARAALEAAFTALGMGPAASSDGAGYSDIIPDSGGSA
jgi:extracellular elastinolytic metalloproteinase